MDHRDQIVIINISVFRLFCIVVLHVFWPSRNVCFLFEKEESRTWARDLSGRDRDEIRDLKSRDRDDNKFFETRPRRDHECVSRRLETETSPSRAHTYSRQPSGSLIHSTGSRGARAQKFNLKAIGRRWEGLE
jgi:hypothetical protein